MKHLKHLFWAAVVVADVYFGKGLPQVVRSLHDAKRQYLYDAIGVYGALALLTLLVIVWVVRGVSGRVPKPAAPARRPGYPFGGGL